MANPFRPFPRLDVPIVGQLVDAYECVPIVTARCLCSEENQPFIIRGVETGYVCARCKRMYGITSVTFDRRTGKNLVAVVNVLGVHRGEDSQNGQAEEPKVN
jgi:hypothetical protein